MRVAWFGHSSLKHDPSDASEERPQDLETGDPYGKQGGAEIQDGGVLVGGRNCGGRHSTAYGGASLYSVTTSIAPPCSISGTSTRAIQKSNCYHKEGHDAPCEYGDSLYILLFGAIQVVFSQIPDFHNLAWLSIVAAVMSFSYSSIGLGLGLAKTIGRFPFVIQVT
ncbi:amino acid permease 6-like [Actinidia eriantha]|uniref:amino acid permease 6-like n=1 Tax=Actinidia eriantha TaxID=165200 RepID=UPI002584B117|nr:amino acid permease 6-like [Actinidia eriantha]